MTPFYRRHGKRLFDLALTIPGLVLLAPLLGLLALVVHWRMGVPVLFRQVRLGLNGRPFKLAKFRTMTDARSSSGELLPDEDRMTRLGRLLRRTSLDELPQLAHVLSGKMSLVGPRPIPPGVAAELDARYDGRYCARPGLTGLAQVSYRGRYRTWEEKAEHDLVYVRRQSLKLDVEILARTALALVRRLRHNKSGASLGQEAQGCSETT